MAASAFTVKPVSVKKHFTWTDESNTEHQIWILIKKELNTGEGRAVATAGWKGVRQQGADAEISIDWKGMTFARVAAYLLDWSLTDENETRMPPNETMLQSLHQDLYDLIEKQIADHVEALELEKKARTTANVPMLTSA
jgi:hypothetical protein